MKLVLFFALGFSSFGVFAADGGWSFGGFFSEVAVFFSDVQWFIFDYIPQLVDRLHTYLVYYIIMLKLNMFKASVEFSFSIAQLILSDIGFAVLLEQLANALPVDVKAFCIQAKIFNGINLVIEAMIARFVMDRTFL